ncbi:hypothetical protein GWN91_02415 [Candidatus Saccharibacteria bacterium]|nr:hypothetical protein [Candidatus Saccharibacteria bacterium]NIU02077.1 hypothetical protein [Nitrosopumilaceae archaeon]NIV03492.1 hypothetical protein [Calditrichia bacterium]NIW78699.1 hypothetical protein [Calditrichia bacterium]NIX62678.1 hypothetical protein [Nitrosopumilaceae archaeon]
MPKDKNLLDMGHLRPGIHELTLSEIEKHFCFNEYRAKLWKKAVPAIKNLFAAGVEDIYLDGSFAESKFRPEDIDGAWVPPLHMDSSRIDPVFWDFKNQRAAMKKKYGVDFFPANALESPKGKTFLEFFQKTRDGQEKGIIKVKLE